MNWKTVPIPDRMKHLPLDRRGYPIPATVMIDDDGKAHFSVNVENIRQRLIKEDRCPICGGKLLRGRWSVGGPASAFHEHGAYIDPPMHYECVRYAMQVCPYLAMPSYTKRIDDKGVDYSKVPGDIIIQTDPTMIDNRPDPFVMVMHVGQEWAPFEGGWGVQYIKPKRPHRRYEFWSKGVELPQEEGMRLAKAYLKEYLQSFVEQKMRDRG